MHSIVLLLFCAAAANADLNARCYQTIDPGPCLAYITKYAYDYSKGECVEFAYGGCRGNTNRFNTMSQCERACMRTRSFTLPETTLPGLPIKIIPLGPLYTGPQIKIIDPSVCTLPLESGPCFAYLPRYGFDASLGKCVQFIYGGCQGNKNNFESMAECQLSCLAYTPMPIRR